MGTKRRSVYRIFPKGYKRERNENENTIIVSDENAILIQEAFEVVSLGLYPIERSAIVYQAEEKVVRR